MGRTNPTYRDALRAIEERWGAFRRALRRRDQPRFDRLFVYAREHADASGALNHRNPLLPALLGIDLEQETRLDDHEERLDDLERQLEAAAERQHINRESVAVSPSAGRARDERAENSRAVSPPEARARDERSGRNDSRAGDPK